jgi:hypothetical protein
MSGMERVRVSTGGPPPAGLAPRLGFVVEIIGFGHRDAREKEDLRLRVDALVSRVVADLGLPRAQVETEAACDATLVFLPPGAPPAHVLPRMISAVAERLCRDNQRYRDRMRLRMAVAAGPPGSTDELYRLVDSRVLRQAISDHEHANLALLVTPELLRSGELDRADFTQVEVKTKDASVPAWLRVC